LSTTILLLNLMNSETCMTSAWATPNDENVGSATAPTVGRATVPAN